MADIQNRMSQVTSENDQEFDLFKKVLDESIQRPAP